ncbi:hypothetical protein [Nonomuraea sp. JJY05]|uniref:hypothetical protein n=1 Tax=Nonomuraea sp. JJY05 TaxID=3350255 RepID=UPI00373EC882
MSDFGLHRRTVRSLGAALFSHEVVLALTMGSWASSGAVLVGLQPASGVSAAGRWWWGRRWSGRRSGRS